MEPLVGSIRNPKGHAGTADTCKGKNSKKKGA